MVAEHSESGAVGHDNPTVVHLQRPSFCLSSHDRHSCQAILLQESDIIVRGNPSFLSKLCVLGGSTPRETSQTLAMPWCDAEVWTQLLVC